MASRHSKSTMASRLILLSLCLVLFPTVLGQGVLLQPSGVGVLLLDGSITITCVIIDMGNGVVNPTYIFNLDGQIVQNSTNENLTISYTNESSISQGGFYECSVTDGGVQVDSGNNITIVFAPIITSDPVDALATADMGVELNCAAAGFPPPLITWYRLMDGANLTLVFSPDQIEDLSRDLPVNSDINITNMTETSVVSTITVDPVEFDDFGDYICVATFDVESTEIPLLSLGELFVNTTFEMSEIATLIVSPLGSVMATPDSRMVSYNEMATFNCTAMGGPDNVLYWVKGTPTFESDIVDDSDFENLTVVSREPELTIMMSNGSNGGVYTCVVFNDAGYDTDSVTLYVSPEILTPPVDWFVENGDMIMLTCIADSFPAPQYQWEKWNMQTSMFEIQPNETDINLVFDPIEHADFGTYRCVVTTPIINETVNASATITVSPLRSVEALPTKQTGCRGCNSTFNCSALGGPMNIFRWVMGSQVMGDLDTSELPINVSMILNSLSYVVSNNDELVITVGTNQTSAQMQGGDYTCFVINEAGFDNSTVTLYISPEIVQDPVDQFVQDGERVILTCLGDSFPAPEYQWERWNITTEKYEEIVGETNNTLVFSSIEHEDYGRYRCVVSTPIINENATSRPALISVSPLRSVMATPADRTAPYNEMATFYCTAMGGPNNTFRWVRENPMFQSNIINENDFENLTIVSREPELTIMMSNGSTGGVYTCVVFNDAGYDTDSVTLYVSPEILTPPVDQFVTNGDMVNLKCIADSFPAPQYQWEKWNMQTSMFKIQPNETDINLVFYPIEHADFGTYRCVVTTPIINETVNASATITVSPLGSIVATPTYQIGSRGNSFTFNCSALGGPMNMFRWVMGAQVMGDLDTSQLPINVSMILNSLSYVVSTNDELVITVGTNQTSAQTQGGEYTCFVINEAGFDNSTVTLYISPEIVQDPEDQFVQNGDNVTLTCVGDSFPAPEYQWERWNMATMEYEEIPGETNSTLVFSSIQHEDYGRYRCVVSTPIINENATSRSALITVSPFESIEALPASQIGSRGDSSTFNCSASGGPMNMFHWVMGTNVMGDLNTNELPINVSETLNSLSYVASTNNELVITVGTNQTSAQMQGGDYTCFVINEAGFDNSTVTLYISPEIVQDPEDQFVKNGDNVTLTCVGDSFPAPEYQWERWNMATMEYEEIPGETNSTLVFSSIEHEDYGRYRCVVSTPIINENATSRSALITVSPFGSIEAVPSYQTGSRGSNSTFNCSALGGPMNTFHWVMGAEVVGDLDTSQLSINVSMILDSLSYVVSTNDELVITVGTNQTSAQMQGGAYTCFVINEAGFDNSTVTLYISPEIVQDPDDQFAQDGDNVTLTCVGDSFPAPEYQWERWNMATSQYEEIVGETNNTLVFSSIQHKDYGRYRCVVSTPIINENATSRAALITVSPLGSIEAEPANQTGSRGENSTFNCLASGGPMNMFHWVMGSQVMGDLDTSQLPINVSTVLNSLSNVVSTNDELVITVGTEETSAQTQGGDYTCFVINEAGFDNSTVTLYISPEIVQDPDNIFVQDGERVTLTCVGDSFPAPEYQWERWNMTTRRYEEILGETNNTLVFSSIEHEDYGRYRCVVSTPIINENATSRSALITVSANNSVMIDPSPSITVDNGSTITFECTAEGGPNNMFVWIRTQDLMAIDTNILPVNINTPINVDEFLEQISDSILINGSILVINSINATLNGGTYTCLVINEAGIGREETILYVRPVITIQPVDILTLAGEMITLTCFADSFPPPQYQWEMMNRSTELFDVLDGEDSTSLVFNAIDYEQYGRYRCRAITSIINVNVTSDEVIITVSPEGSVLIDPPITNSFNDSSVLLTCNARGGPMNTFQWTYLRTGEVVNESSTHTFISTIYTGGEYECTVSNDAGNDTDNATVNVGPIIIEDPESMNVSIFIHNITLTCVAIGIPVPIITWAHNDTLLNENGEPGEFENGIYIQSIMESLGTVMSVLTIDSALANHTGEYYCNATSPVDFYEPVMSDIALVLVQNVPEPPINLTATVINSRNVTLVWVEPHDNNAPILRYRVYFAQPFFLGGNMLFSETMDDTETIVISNLHPGEIYNFTVVAINEEGTSERSDPLTVRTLEEVPSGFPQGLFANTTSSTTIEVSWDEVLVNETNGVITEYFIEGIPDDSFADVVNDTVDSSVFSIEFDGLEEFVNYSFAIRASTEVGFGPQSPVAAARTDEAAPASPPQNFSVAAITANTISLQWELPPERDINGIIRNYIIRYRIIEQLGVSVITDPMEMTQTVNAILTTTLMDLDNYTVYNISITAVTVGEGPLNTIRQRTDENAPEAPPVFITATTNSNTSIIVRWGPPPLNMTNGIIDSYEIRYGRYDSTMNDITRDISNITIEGNRTFEVEIGELQEFIEYGFQVRAVTVAPGPYTDFAVNTTFQAPPMVAPMLPDDAVPDETRRARSVVLSWNPLDPDDANGELTYNVTINVRGQTPESRRKRETSETNTLQQCLEAAGISPVFAESVPGDQTNLTLNDIAPFTEYSFTVAGVTGAGTGPSSSPPFNFSTIEGVPTEPREVNLMNSSSTSLRLMWQPPICDNGVRTGYTIMFTALPVPLFSPGVLGDQDQLNTRSRDDTELSLTGLSPNSPYEIVICANTGTGCGVNITINQTTTEDAPLPVENLNLDNSSVSNITVSWLSPSSRNGSFNVLLNYTGSQVFVYSNRIQTGGDEMILMGSETRITRSVPIVNLLPYAEYIVTLTTYNRLFGQTLSRESVTATIITQPTASSAVRNLQAVAITATNILVQWEIPQYPNGPITNFQICINATTCNLTNPTAVHFTLTELNSSFVYDITVQPLTMFQGTTLMGIRSDPQRVAINTSSNVTGPNGAGDTNTGSLVFQLPSYTLFGGTVIFYGVVVTRASFNCESVTDFGNEFPNPQPKEIADNLGLNYYIAAGWSNTSNIPNNFRVGGGGTTMAVRLGRQETYTNPSLSRERTYCVFVFVNLDSGVPGQPIVRYVNLGTAKTNLGYNRPALGIFMTLLIIAIIVGIVVLVFFISRRYKTEIYSVVNRSGRGNSQVLDTVANGTGGGGTDLVIVNKPLENPGEPQFVDPSSSKQPIHVKDFPTHVTSMHSNDDYLFSVEYPSVEPRHSPTTEATHHPDNAVKNRYANIVAYDHSRVRLDEIPNVPGSDYINACYIDGYKAENAYIASQGPVPHSVSDFWRMVWERNSATIVMLTNLEEKGRIKCSMYWPAPNKRVQIHGLIRVQLQEELHLSDHTIRTFSLQKEKGDERIVKQFHFTAWPDFGVPEHPTPLLRFIRKVEVGNPANAGPMIVHCSAGVGRTGTFITISTQIKRIKDVETIDIFNFVQSMRYRRCFMVQTEAQYIFIHDALLEVIECGETEVSARELKDKYRKLSTFNDTEGLMNIEVEYERIQDTIHTEPIRHAGTLQCNRQKNRFHNVIPFDKTRCRLSAVPGVDGSDYVNANFIEGYLKGKAFVATQGPLPDTTEDFWRMVWEYKSSTIVMLAKEKEGTKVMCHRYWPDETTGSEMHGPFEISLHSVREYPDYVLREIKIVDTRDQEGSSQHIKQYHYTGWPKEGVPSSAIGLLDIREQVEKWQRNSGDKPIIVHCSGGCGRTGTYIAICLLIDRLKTEGVMDIFQTVRGLRLQRPGMVRSVEQYDFVYKAILEYLGSFDNYANFSL